MDANAGLDLRHGGEPGADKGNRVDAVRVQRVNRWLIGAVVVLALALVAVGTWAIVERSTEDEAASPPMRTVADISISETIDALHKATSGERFASFFAEDGVLVDRRAGATEVIKGRTAIARYMNARLWSVGEPVGAVAQWGNFAAHAVKTAEYLRWQTTEDATITKLELRIFTGMNIYEFNSDGKITHLWAFGDYAAFGPEGRLWG